MLLLLELPVACIVIMLLYLETFVVDTLMMMAGYADVIVMRHPKPGAVMVRRICLLGITN
jgi:hypothetical protein